MPKNQSDTIFSISLEKGLADRHRLPIGQVISVLNGVRQMLIDAGRELQKQRGVGYSHNLDFGLELVADEHGHAFTKGSLRAKIAITSNVELGIEAAGRVLQTVRELNAPPKKPIKRIGVSQDSVQSGIVNHLDRMAFIHDRSKVQAKFRVIVPRALKPKDSASKNTVVFGAPAIRRLAALREPVFSEENVTLYGKLVELKDRSQMDDTHGKFWGELRRDNGERWRIQFDDDCEATAVPLFRQQVCVYGTAHYFQTRTPKLIASGVDPDATRDYVAAFDGLFGANKDKYNADLPTLLARRYGEG